jgi:hypothetical protein
MSGLIFYLLKGGAVAALNAVSRQYLCNQICAKEKHLEILPDKPGGDRVHVCVMGWKWGHTGVVHRSRRILGKNSTFS